jgi:hypothetical protein
VPWLVTIRDLKDPVLVEAMLVIAENLLSSFITQTAQVAAQFDPAQAFQARKDAA